MGIEGKEKPIKVSVGSLIVVVDLAGFHTTCAINGPALEVGVRYKWGMFVKQHKYVGVQCHGLVYVGYVVL